MAGSEGRSAGSAYGDYVRLIQQVDELVAAFEAHPDEATREHARALLAAVDLLHRTALERLVEGLRHHGVGPVVEAVAADRIVETLLGLYGLAELDLPDEEPGGADAVVAFVPREKLGIRRAGGAR